MMAGIIGKKLGMTQVYDENGKVVPVTVIQAGPCPVLDIRTQEADGYSALQLGFGKRKAKNISKAVLGHLAKSQNAENPPSLIKEVRLTEDSSVELGSLVTVADFSEIAFVDVIGTTKGKGFQGVVKRYNFGGGRASHGGDWTRKPGSIGMCEFPGEVYKGRKMPGQTGNVQRTIMGLKVVSVRTEDNVLLVKGAVPGPKGGTVVVRTAKKK
ncbi:MAG: 50S ribosomal protein L3 [Lentisphaeraceae bacterium]|nr:50S ribosomal protein L3 [Lentisphaeraceae bacterium]